MRLSLHARTRKKRIREGAFGGEARVGLLLRAAQQVGVCWMLLRCPGGVSTRKVAVTPCDAEWKSLSRKPTPRWSSKSNQCLASYKDLHLSTGQKAAQMWTWLNLRSNQGKDNKVVDARQKQRRADSLESEQIKALGPSSLGCPTQKGHHGQSHSRLLPSWHRAGWIHSLDGYTAWRAGSTVGWWLCYLWLRFKIVDSMKWPHL